MIKIGITGNIGVGKSYVLKILSKMGYPVFISDKIAKELMNKNKDLKALLKNNFGESIFRSGQIDKNFIKNKIFNSNSLRNQLNSLVHPFVNDSFELWCKAQDSQIIFKEAAIIYETGLNKKLDFVICISAEYALQISRVKARDGMDALEINQILKNQMKQSEKEKLSDFVINNNENQSLLLQINEILNKVIIKK
jgi:dephospho-CoA kinase